MEGRSVVVHNGKTRWAKGIVNKYFNRVIARRCQYLITIDPVFSREDPSIVL